MRSGYGHPIIRDTSGKIRTLKRVPLQSNNGTLVYNESTLEDLLFDHPDIIPIVEIDQSYIEPVAICTQLQTKVGILDVLYLTSTGRLVIVEAKLWRNPEARRKVVGQIIEYAAEISRWSYEDLQREVIRRTGKSGSSLYEFVRAKFPDTDEVIFIDNVAKSLREGRFLLIVCGDGIREELVSIGEYLERNTTLDFTFGLLELALFATNSGAILVQPRVLAKTITIQRHVVVIENASYRIEAGEEQDIDDVEGPSEPQLAILQFWKDLSAAMVFDDPSQPPPNATLKQNTSLRMPSPRTWITLYFSKGDNETGLFLTFNRGEPGDTFWSRLQDEKEAINSELPQGIRWASDGNRHQIILTTQRLDINDAIQRQAAIEWFKINGNKFVNAFRPRLQQYQSEL